MCSVEKLITSMANKFAQFPLDFVKQGQRETCGNQIPTNHKDQTHFVWKGHFSLILPWYLLSGINMIYSIFLLQLAGCLEGFDVFYNQSKARNTIKMAGSCFLLCELKIHVKVHLLRKSSSGAFNSAYAHLRHRIHCCVIYNLTKIN